MQGTFWISVGLIILLGQAYCFDAPTSIYSSAQVNGTEGKPTSINTQIPKTKICENCMCQWLKNNKTIEDNYGNFKNSEDRSTGDFSMEIISTQRNDTGSYKIVCDNEIESRETFLNVIEIPSQEYPVIELQAINGLLVLYGITEILSPIPKLTLNEEEHILYKNTTHFWINKTVPITSVIPNVTYICVLQLKGYYRHFETINGSQIIDYWNKTADERKVIKTMPLIIAVNGHEEDSTTNDWLLLAFKIAGGMFGGAVTIASLYLVINSLRKSLNKKTSDDSSSLEMGGLMLGRECEVAGPND